MPALPERSDGRAAAAGGGRRAPAATSWLRPPRALDESLLKRLPEIEDVAAAVLFLLSDQA